MADDLDRKDVEILKMLKNDSRTPMGIIGENLGISKATVSRRIASMEDNGTISGYSLNVNHSSMGVMKSLVSMQIANNPVDVVIGQLKEIEEIGYIYKTFGDHNLVCEVYTHSFDELYNLIQTKILKNPAVRNVEIDVIVEGMKMNENADFRIVEKDLKEKM